MKVEIVPSRNAGLKELPEFSRVYFIGAGFSAGAGYPVGRELVPQLMCWLQRARFRDAQDKLRQEYILTATSRLLGHYLGVSIDLTKAGEEKIRAAFAGVDVAEFYSMAHALAEMPALFDSRPVQSAELDPFDLSRLYEFLSAATRSYFLHISEQRERLPKDMDAILNNINERRHAIVNFNWDEEVDILLSTWEEDGADDDQDHLAYTIHGWTSKRFVHLKPHGSIGWYDVKQGLANDDLYFIADDDNRIRRSEQSILAFSENELPKDVDGEWHPRLSCPPVIMPPTFTKRFEFAEQQMIWRDVIELCGHAHEFVFLGYSLPFDDFLTRAAIRRSISGRTGQDSVKCLLVGTSCGEHVVRNFASVFPGFSVEGHFLQWTFGKPQAHPAKAHIAEEIERRLKKRYGC